MKNLPKDRHHWKFFKTGGFVQPLINSGADIENLSRLDQKLWCALSCPTKGLVFDQKTLELIDSDSDSRIRHNEIVDAAKWLCARLKDKNEILKNSKTLSLENIDDSTENGKNLLSSAKQILTYLDKPQATEISIEDFADFTKIFANTVFNSDGIITSSACDTPELLQTFTDISSVCPTKLDRSGKMGIDAQAIESFYTQASELINWENLPNQDKSILYFGENTKAAFDAFKSVELKIDDFFTRRQMLSFDSAAADAINPQQQQLSQALSVEISNQSESLKEFPIAKITADKTLDLIENTNPAWTLPLLNFANLVTIPLFKTSKISIEQWEKIKEDFKPLANWISKKPDTKLEILGNQRIDEILKQNLKQEFLNLIQKDLSLKNEVDLICEVEKLVRFNAYFNTLLQNFVNFSKFYEKSNCAIFQYGKLYIDKRECRLCIKVDDIAAHAQMASLSYSYILYCTCKRIGQADITIAAAVTTGDDTNLMVGRHGIFYDTQNNDWDATVVKIISNPICISQAFFSPYKRFGNWINAQLIKLASSADEKTQKDLTSISTVKSIDVGTVAALGVAVGGITTAFGMILNAFFKLGFWMPLGLLGILLAISLPSMLIAAIKLRSRNLAPLLDANGWAINSKASISMTFGENLTKSATLPEGAKRISSNEALHEERSKLTVIFFLIAFIATILASLWYSNQFTYVGLDAPSWSIFHKDTPNTSQKKALEENKALSSPNNANSARNATPTSASK